MTYLIIYLLLGIALSAVTFYDEGGADRRAILHPGFVLFFALLWPVILAYVAHRIAVSGTIKYKGKVIWRAKK